MKVMVTGAGGQLGRAVLHIAGGLGGCEASGLCHGDLAVEDRDAVLAKISAIAPEVVIHCAAWTDVDGCEGDPQRADRINGQGTAHVAQACRAVGAGLVYISTDFVFSGDADQPYRTDSPTGPVSAYGHSKLLGEQAVLSLGDERFWVLRTSWVFGPGGRNFPRAIIDSAKAGKTLKVVADQVGSPTMTLDLARAILDLASAEAAPGIYHGANEGSCSWYQFARDVLDLAGMSEVPIDRISSADLDRPARRPAYSILDCSQLTRVRGRALPDYHDALQRYLTNESDIK